MIIPKLVLFLFVAFECFLAWCGRFLPRRDRSTALVKGFVAVILASAATGGVVAEALLYRSLTGQVSLRDDNFWFTVMIIQGLIVIPVAINSGSVLKRKEREP
jgi:putative copper export protein